MDAIGTHYRQNDVPGFSLLYYYFLKWLFHSSTMKYLSSDFRRSLFQNKKSLSNPRDNFNQLDHKTLPGLKLMMRPESSTTRLDVPAKNNCNMGKICRIPFSKLT